MTYTQNGRIIKMTGGLYTVRLDPAGESPSPLANTVVECRARGQFRHARVSPLVGDRVTVQYDHTSFSLGEDGVARPSGDRSGLMIAEILPRKNSLIRPPLANVDTMLTVVAAASPDPDIPTVDKLLSILTFNRIVPVLVITKCELDPARAAELKALYEQAGFRVFVLSSYTGEGVDELAAFTLSRGAGEITPDAGEILAVAGASGAGKSTLLNTIFPDLGLTTGELSEKIGRGKNTTRHTELFDLGDGTDGNRRGNRRYIADTAGFSLLDFERFDFFTLEDLPHTFPEFAPYLGQCRYTDCTHTADEGCALLAAVKSGEIVKSRHDAYVELYKTLKEKKKW